MEATVSTYGRCNDNYRAPVEMKLQCPKGCINIVQAKQDCTEVKGSGVEVGVEADELQTNLYNYAKEKCQGKSECLLNSREYTAVRPFILQDDKCKPIEDEGKIAQFQIWVWFKCQCPENESCPPSFTPTTSEDPESCSTFDCSGDGVTETPTERFEHDTWSRDCSGKDALTRVTLKCPGGCIKFNNALYTCDQEDIGEEEEDGRRALANTFDGHVRQNCDGFDQCTVSNLDEERGNWANTVNCNTQDNANGNRIVVSFGCRCPEGADDCQPGVINHQQCELKK